MLENSETKIKDLIIGFLSKNTNSEENSILFNWLKQSEENFSFFLQIKRVWQISSQTIPAKEEMVNKDLNTVLAKLNIQPKKQKTASRRLTYFSVAASIIIMFGLGFTASHFIQIKKENLTESQLCRIVVPKGAKTMAQLPDGSTIWLNAESSLTYNPNNFNKENRKVKLVGEGYFSITTNPKKPFVVETKNIKVKAFGTEFNVRSYPEDVTVETTLIHGIVKVEGENSNNKHFEISIKPNQKITCYTKENIPKSGIAAKPLVSDNVIVKKNNPPALPSIKDDVNTILYTSWKDDRWVIEGERIGNLAVKLERRFNVEFNFESEDIMNYEFTGTFQNETLEQVMQIIKLTAPICYKIEKGKVLVSTNKRLKTKYEKYIN